MRRALALTWFQHRRTKELCAGLDIELLVLTTKLGGLLRYLVLSARTLVQLARRRPKVVLVQNPSLILAALAAAVRGVLGYRLVVDAHNEAVVPFINRQRWVARLAQWVIRRADLTIVSNRQLAERVLRQGGKPYTLPDRIPMPPPVPARTLSGTFNVVLIATFAPDEPIAWCSRPCAVWKLSYTSRAITTSWTGLSPPECRGTCASPGFSMNLITGACCDQRMRSSI
jgi:hypothetical protein